MIGNTRWSMKTLRDFWVSDELANIKPQNWGEFPEGFDPRIVIAHLYQWIEAGAVTELGCGYGRLCGAFSNKSYRGLDINPGAITKAREHFPDYEFDIIESPLDLPGGMLLMAYTVFLHMPDEVLVPWIRAAVSRYRYVLVCEILGRDWRKTAGTTPVFNRDLKDYIELLAPFTLAAEIRIPYRRYAKSDFVTRISNTDISFMLFASEDAGLDGLRNAVL